MVTLWKGGYERKDMQEINWKGNTEEMIGYIANMKGRQRNWNTKGGI